MYKQAFALLCVVAMAYAGVVAPVGYGLGGLSYTQRINGYGYGGHHGYAGHLGYAGLGYGGVVPAAVGVGHLGYGGLGYGGVVPAAVGVGHLGYGGLGYGGLGVVG